MTGSQPGIDASVPDADAATDAEVDAAGEDASSPPIPDPAEMGPYEVIRRSYSIRFGSSESVAIEVSSPTGLTEAPMVFFARGTAVVRGFETLSEHLASHGLLVVQPVTECHSSAVLCTVTRQADNAATFSQFLSREWDDVGLPLRPTTVGFLGHGRGAKVAGLVAGTWEARDGTVPPAFLIVPDNTPPRGGFSAANPDGHVSAQEIRRVGVFGTAVTGVCEDQDYLLREADFERQPGQVVWEWFAERSRWMDFVSDPALCGDACDVCGIRPSADRLATQQALRRYTAAFFRFTLAEDLAAEPWLAEVDLEGMLMTRYPAAAP